MMGKTAIVGLALACSTALAADPATGWMAYAVGAPPTGVERITRLEMTWKAGAEPKHHLFAFFAPWFGMDPADNLNLIQPVNPWGGSAWSIYTEYFQWKPTHNSNSKSVAVAAGDVLHGTLLYDNSTDSYTLSHEHVQSGETSTQVVKCQDGKKFTVPYVVYEKAFPCNRYPPDEIVTFYDIKVECDYRDCASEMLWEAKNFDNKHCDMQAHIAPGNQNISITWDTTAASKLDGLSDAALFDLNHHGWATALNLERPRE